MADDVIKEFLVSIGVDTQDVDRFEETLKRVGKGVKVFAESAVAATAALSAAVVKIADDFDTLYFQMKNLGSSAGDIKALGYAFSQLGGSAGDASAAMQAIANFNMSYGEGAKGFLQQLGVDPKDIGDSAKTLIDLEKIFQRMAGEGGNGLARATAIGERLGLSQDTMRMMMRDNGEFEAQFNQMTASMGNNLDDAAERSHKFMLELRQLKEQASQIFTNLELDILRSVVPLLKDVTTWMNNMATGKNLSGVSQELRNVILDIGDLLKALGELAQESSTQRFATRILFILDNMIRGLGSFARAADLIARGKWAEAWQEAIKDTDRPWDSAGKPAPGPTNYSDDFKHKMGAPTDQEMGLAPAGAGAAPAGGRAKQVIDYFKQKGASDVLARGVAAMLFSESGLDHKLPNKQGSGAYGLAQWLSKDRLAAFKAMFGHSIQQSSFDEQLRFVQHELAGKYVGVWNEMKRAVDPLTVADIGIHGYEAPGAKGERSDHKGAARFLGVSPSGGRIGSIEQHNTYHIHGGDTGAVVDGVAGAQQRSNAQLVGNAAVFQW